MKKIGLSILSLTLFASLFMAFTPKPTLKLALLKYNGGGDWYNDVNSLKNLAIFCNRNLGTNFDTETATVEVGSAEIFNYPFVYMTGHGNVVFSNQEAQNLRTYLQGGGFLFINDDFGMDPFVRPAMKRCSLKPNWSSYLIRTLFIIKNMISRMVCLKYMNTTANPQKATGFCGKDVW